ncbi:DUF1653 domain-containing protein [[Clostridium] symbiosum]|uniref:DUF1653 domain-containing protein n=1 Tax=Clostridium symbiosum TaxID=1512 RepID=UPI001D064669|nr:DUF1653 domain-containing protein [[Clostridium] symbiosum]MCB6608810.1 DUF1653 domain-containing protein [[Clostridium] symbiosum]MCB6929588.1 DUF1653 domain-containing protein [[Clostridium] symbiosum]
MNAVPKPGEFYRHFKNKMYQIMAVANHSETGEKMVVYQALYGDYSVWVRPLSMFMEEVDRSKYPDAVQKYRFEQVYPGQEQDAANHAAGTAKSPAADREMHPYTRPEEAAVSPMLLEFLDTESFEERLAILQRMKGRVGQREVDSLCLCLDAKPSDGTIEEQIDGLKQYLRMQQRYDASRLRRG